MTICWAREAAARYPLPDLAAYRRAAAIVRQAIANGLRCLPIHQEALLLSCELRQSHTDPFDRLIYAQAKHGGYRLLSIDRRLAAFGATVLTPK